MQITLTLGLSLALAAASPMDPARGGDPDQIVPTTLSEIRKTPDAFRNVVVAFDVQFTALGRVQNPFFTRFIPTAFTNFHAWANEQSIWRRGDYDDAFGYLFMSKENRQLQRLFQFDVYDRMRCKGVVRDTFQGKPWIEVLSFEPIGGKVSTATLAHLYRGEQYMAQRAWSRAISELSLAAASVSPKHVTAAAHRSLAVCYLRLGEAPAAKRHLKEAITILGTDLDDETKRLSEIVKVDPARELDNVVDPRAVREHERPLWEAFEDVSQSDAGATPVVDQAAAPALPNK